MGGRQGQLTPPRSQLQASVSGTQIGMPLTFLPTWMPDSCATSLMSYRKLSSTSSCRSRSAVSSSWTRHTPHRRYGSSTHV